MDIAALLDSLIRKRSFQQLASTLLTQWGPSTRPYMAANILPPRFVENEGTLERVRFKTVAALDGSRYSPAQMIDGGELYGRVNWRLGHSDLARQITGQSYDAVQRYLSRDMPMQAAASVIGLFDQFIIQAMVEHDEIAAWQAILKGQVTKRGSNGYLEYEDMPDYTGMRTAASVSWTDDDTDPYTSDIIPMFTKLVDNGYALDGIRLYTTYKVLLQLSNHPATYRRLVTAPLATGQSVQEAVGVVTVNDVKNLLTQKFGIKSVETNDMRVETKTGELRVFDEGYMCAVASTGISEQVLYNQDNPADVKLVPDVIGFQGIGTPNGLSQPQRGYAVRAITNEKSARLEFEGWQATGPVIMTPEAIAVISGIALGTIVAD